MPVFKEGKEDNGIERSERGRTVIVQFRIP